MSKSNLSKVTHYPNFDWLRLLLAIQVVAIHCGIAPNVFMNPVPAFLAISGFVVLGSMERRPIGQFFVNRALRVLPLLAVSFIAVGIFWSPQEMVRNILYWLWPTGDAPANPVVWTLIYEEVFYIILAILFSLGIYKRKIVPILICGFIMAMTIAFKFIILPKQWYMLGSAFFLGNIMYLYRDKIAEKLDKRIATVLFIGSIAAVYWLPYNSIVRNPMAYIDFVSFAAMIAFAISGPQLPRLKIDMSYSLYLTHYLVLAQLIYFVPLGQRLFWFVLLSSLPICYMAWHLIEKPALNLKVKFFAEAEEVIVAKEA